MQIIPRYRITTTEPSFYDLPEASESEGNEPSIHSRSVVSGLSPVATESLSAKVRSLDEWSSIGDDCDLSRNEAETAIFEILSQSLDACIRKKGKRMELIHEQLREYVNTIATAYEKNSDDEYTLVDVLNLLRRTEFLWESRAVDSKSAHELGACPWDHFVLLFGAFVHRVKHTGSTNAALESQRHVIAQMYEGLSSCQQRRSVDFAFTAMEDDLEDLYEEITFGCPNFRSLVRKAVLSTDLDSETCLHSMLGQCDRLNSSTEATTCQRQSRQRNTANIGLILAAATVARFTQSRNLFLQESCAQYEMHNSEGSPEKSWDSWYYDEVMFLKAILLPLIDEVLRVLPGATYLKQGATENIAFWVNQGIKFNTPMVGQPSSRSSRSPVRTTSSNSISNAETYLASQMVTEAEWLSKIMSRYERKYETVLGNLGALAYKGRPCPFRKTKDLSEVHQHFKQQEWYRAHVNNEKILRRSKLLGELH